MNRRTLSKIADLFAESVDEEALQLADWIEAQPWRGANVEKAERIAVVLRANQPLKMAGRILQATLAATTKEAVDD